MADPSEADDAQPQGMINGGTANAAPSQDATDDSGERSFQDKIEDPILKQAEAAVESRLTPKNRANYIKIVVAGMKVALRGGPNGILAGLKTQKDPVYACAVGAINLVSLMKRSSRGTMPPQAAVPAAMTLMLQALDFAERSGLVKVDQDVLTRATKIFTDMIFRSMHISTETLQGATKVTHGILANPQQMDILRKRVGADGDGNAYGVTSDGTSGSAAPQGEGE